MSPATQVEKADGTRRGTPRLDDFLIAVRDSNPFTSNRVTEPSAYDVDVPAIHAASFDRLVALANQALRDRSGIGAALLGGAGIGKSHLLSRLYRWANEPVQDGGPRACYVYLHNILADSDRLPDYFRDPPLPLYPWLRRLAWERLVDLHRQHLRARRRSVTLEVPAHPGLSDESCLALAERLIASGTNPSGRLIRQELRQRVQSLVRGER
jgi:hypothetical protein